MDLYVWFCRLIQPPLKLLRSNLSVLQQTETGKGINIAGCLVLEQSRGIENRKKSS
jgi:hypothetical protein